jgi:hypothetical protein
MDFNLPSDSTRSLCKKTLQKNFAKKPGWLLAKNVIFSGCQMATLIAT